MVVVRVENTVRGGLDMLGAELRGRFSVKTGRPRSAMLWDCTGWLVSGGEGRERGVGWGMNILSNQWRLGLCCSGGLSDVGGLGQITCMYRIYLNSSRT